MTCINAENAGRRQVGWFFNNVRLGVVCRAIGEPMFGHEWQRIEGRVLVSREKPNWVKWHSGTPLACPRQFLIEYSPDGSEKKKVELEGSPDKVSFPAVGDVVPLLVDPRSGKVKFDVDDPRIGYKAKRLARTAAEDADFRRERDD